MLNVIDGNLLDSNDTYIAHQCNCVTTKVSGVAKAIFEKYPIANDNENGTHGKFGEVKIHKIDNNRYILNMFTQYNTGDPKADKEDREVAFGQALLRMANALHNHSKKNGIPFTISLPYMIGCGLAGGNWEHYSMMLEFFAEIVRLKGGEVTLYKLPEKAQ